MDSNKVDIGNTGGWFRYHCRGRFCDTGRKFEKGDSHYYTPDNTPLYIKADPWNTVLRSREQTASLCMSPITLHVSTSAHVMGSASMAFSSPVPHGITLFCLPQWQTVQS